MSKTMGVYRQKNGLWYYRFTITQDGKKTEKRSNKDDSGNLLKTERAAIKARDAARAKELLKVNEKPQIKRQKIKQIYEEYCNSGRLDRAYMTIKKQDSLWKNHLSKRFGNIYVDNLSSAEINDYLSELYFVNGYAFKYVEAFLKMFYLIFGQAYSRNYLPHEIYTKLCVNKDTKIRMPKMKDEDDTDIIAFDRSQLSLLDDYFKNTNAETAYLLGKYCGLRINECFGLKWENVDLKSGTITIDRQMQYQEGLIKLVPPKTLNGKRQIPLNDTLLKHLKKRAAQEKENAKINADIRRQKERYIEDLDGKMIPASALVNCLADGTIQTVNSFKYPSREIKTALGIDFKYHYLRHTFGTNMAEINTPQHLLCKIMGHGNIHVTQRYYLAVTKSGAALLKDMVNRI